MNLRNLAKAENVEYLLDEEEKEKNPEEEDSKRETRSARSAVDDKHPERISARQKQAKEKQDYDKEIPIENIDWDKVTIAERESWKQRYFAKEAELAEKIHALQHGNAIYPVGRDRTFRRYWMFSSIPGLFVEDQEEYVPDEFFKAVPQTGSQEPFNSKNLPLSNVQSDGSEEKSTSSDKENDQKLLNGATVTAKVLTDLNKSVNKNIESMNVDEKPPTVQTETVDEQISHRNTACWSYIETQEQSTN